MKPDIVRLDSRNLEDWWLLGALGERICRMNLFDQGATEEQADLNVRATFAEWAQSPDTVGLWVVHDLDWAFVECPGEDFIGHAVAFIRAEEGKLYAMFWQMQMDKPNAKWAKALSSTVDDWAKQRGCSSIWILTPHNPEGAKRMFGDYSMRKDL